LVYSVESHHEGIKAQRPLVIVNEVADLATSLEMPVMPGKMRNAMALGKSEEKMQDRV